MLCPGRLKRSVDWVYTPAQDIRVTQLAEAGCHQQELVFSVRKKRSEGIESINMKAELEICKKP